MPLLLGIFCEMIINWRVTPQFLKSSFSHAVFVTLHSLLHAYDLIPLILLLLSSS